MNERANLDSLTPGMAAFDALGAPIGKVETIEAEGFHVAGHHFPASAIARIDAAGVHLHAARAAAASAVADAAIAGADQHGIAREDERIVIPLAEERLHVATREVELGEVYIRKRVVTEERMIPVTSRREEVEVLRRGPGEDWPAGALPEGAELTRIPLRRWEPVVATEAIVTREAVVEKARVAEEGRVASTIRREHAEVDERYAHIRPTLEREFSSTQGASGRTFAEAEPQYRAGFRAGSDPQYVGRDFAEVETSVRREYDATNQYGDDAWERLRQEIRAGYEAARRS